MADKIKIRMTNPKESGIIKTFTLHVQPSWLILDWEGISMKAPPHGDLSARLQRFFANLERSAQRLRIFAGDPEQITTDYRRGEGHYVRANGEDYACPCNAGNPCVRPGA